MTAKRKKSVAKKTRKSNPTGRISREPANCDPNAVSVFDYSKLDPALGKLAKPAQRALINNGILTVKSLSDRTLSEIKSFHGLGPSSIPRLKEILKKAGRTFKG